MLLVPILVIVALSLPVSATELETGTITASSDTLYEGRSLSLSTNMSGTVTWSSSSIGVATVSSSGIVKGVNAG